MPASKVRSSSLPEGTADFVTGMLVLLVLFVAGEMVVLVAGTLSPLLQVVSFTFSFWLVLAVAVSAAMSSLQLQRQKRHETAIFTSMMFWHACVRVRILLFASFLDNISSPLPSCLPKSRVLLPSPLIALTFQYPPPPPLCTPVLRTMPQRRCQSLLARTHMKGHMYNKEARSGHCEVEKASFITPTHKQS
jgi:hypothetical protein